MSEDQGKDKISLVASEKSALKQRSSSLVRRGLEYLDEKPQISPSLVQEIDPEGTSSNMTDLTEASPALTKESYKEMIAARIFDSLVRENVQRMLPRANRMRRLKDNNAAKIRAVCNGENGDE